MLPASRWARPKVRSRSILVGSARARRYGLSPRQSVQRPCRSSKICKASCRACRLGRGRTRHVRRWCGRFVPTWRTSSPGSWCSALVHACSSTTVIATSASWSPARWPRAIANARAYEEERKRAEALAEIDRAKTAFFSNVSHEFRTPLTLMLGPLEDELRENSKGRERIEIAHRNSLRLLKLVNTLLDFARIEAGRIEAVYEPTDLAAATAELASVFRSAIEKAGLRLVVDCPPLPEEVYVDREMWEKIVLNLLSNAFKFTFEGEIKVSLCLRRERVELSVSDTGAGIPAAELSHIFERFHRVRGTDSRTHEGTGIGLSLVQELAKIHGGGVQVRSVEGQGATFTVTIPTGHAHLPKERLGGTRSLMSTSLGATPFVEEALRWLPDGTSSSASHRSGELGLTISSMTSRGRAAIRPHPFR